MTLSDKVAIVTGSSQGIGKSIALELAKHGATLVLAARSADGLERTAEEIAKAGGKSTSFPGDLSRPEAPAALVQAALDSYGQVDIVVNCAGGSKRGNILDLEDRDWESALSLKLFGALRLIKAAWPHLAKQQGSVVNICGVAGRTPKADHAIAAVTNGGYMALTKSIAELGTRSGVRVNAINPGVVRTRRSDAELTRMNVNAQDETAIADALRMMAQDLSMNRIGTPADIATLVAYLVSPHGTWFHGALIDLDGGATKGL